MHSGHRLRLSTLYAVFRIHLVHMMLYQENYSFHTSIKTAAPLEFKDRGHFRMLMCCLSAVILPANHAVFR